MIEVLRLGAEATTKLALKKAIYRLSETVPLTFHEESNEFVLLSTRNVSDDEKHELLRCIADYSLREEVSAKTEHLRDAILSIALLRLTDSNEE